MADKTILVAGTVPCPADWTVPATADLEPKIVKATFDGAAAAGSFLPALIVLSDAGLEVARVPVAAADVVAAGGSATVTWFPGGSVGGAGGAAGAFVGCRVTQPLGQLLASSAPTDMTWSAVGFDTDGMTDLTHENHRITCRTAGYYWVGVSADFGPNNTGDRETRITLNGLYSTGTGTLVAYSNLATTQHNTLQSGLGCATLLHLDAGDYITAGVLQSCGAVLGVSGGTQHYFAAARIG